MTNPEFSAESDLSSIEAITFPTALTPRQQLSDGDLANLRHFPNLSSLKIRQASVFEIEEVPESLAYLTLDGTSVTNLEFLDDLPHFKSLILVDCHPQAVQNAGKLSVLERLTIVDAPITEFIPSGLANLESLSLHDCQLLRSFGGMSNCPNVRTVAIRNSLLLTNLAALEELKELRGLTLKRTGIRDIEFLRGLEKLESLSLEECFSVDYSGLRHARSLTSLYLINCNIDSLNTIRGLGELEALAIDGTCIDELEPLSMYSRIEFLSLRRSKVESLAALAGLEEIGYLNVCGTEIEHLQSIENVKIGVLVISPNQFPDHVVDDFRKDHPECTVEIDE